MSTLDYAVLAERATDHLASLAHQCTVEGHTPVYLDPVNQLIRTGRMQVQGFCQRCFTDVSRSASDAERRAYEDFRVEVHQPMR